MRTNKPTAWLLLLLTCCLMTNQLNAQKAYLSVSAGYALPMGQQTLTGISFSNYTVVSNGAISRQAAVSLGAGMNWGASVGYLFNKNLGAELSFSYLKGAEQTAQNVYPTESTHYSLQSNAIRMIPSLVITCKVGGVNPYARLGLLISNGYVTYGTTTITDEGSSETVVEMKGGTGLGVSSAMGAAVKLNKKLSVFGELNLISLAYAPTRSEMTRFTYLGTDLLSNLTVCERKKIFVDELISDYTQPQSDSEPTQELKHNLPFSSFGINIGLRISLDQ